jgi:arginase
MNPEPPRRLGLLGLPWDGGSSFLRGAAEAPGAIRAALHSGAGNLWSEAGLDLGAPGVLEDHGDVPGLAALRPEAAAAAIEEAVARVLAAGDAPLLLGGDHSVTYPALRAVARGHPRLTVLHLDAHPDLYDEFEGDRLSHACPLARVMEEGLCGRLVQVGIRTMNGAQRAQAVRFGAEVIDMRAWDAGSRPQVEGPAYLSMDLDVLDPAFAPGVSHREPGGLTVREVARLVQGLGGVLVGADLVELNPARDPEGTTATVAAKLLKELGARLRGGAPHRERTVRLEA